MGNSEALNHPPQKKVGVKKGEKKSMIGKEELILRETHQKRNKSG